MIKSIIWFLEFAITLVLSFPNLIKAKRILKKSGQKEFDEFSYRITSEWAKKRIMSSGADISIHNSENIPCDKNVLFVSNHQSDFDIAIFMALINKPTGFVAKVELQKIPILRTWMENIHCVFMDRKDLKQSVQTIFEGIKILKQGYSMVIFPEGTRSKSGQMSEFKAGSFKLATKSKVPIVPVTINGSYKILEGNNYIINPARADVYIHEPIFTGNLTKDEINELPEKVKNIIQSKLNA